MKVSHTAVVTLDADVSDDALKKSRGGSGLQSYKNCINRADP